MQGWEFAHLIWAKWANERMSDERVSEFPAVYKCHCRKEYYCEDFRDLKNFIGIKNSIFYSGTAYSKPKQRNVRVKIDSNSYNLEEKKLKQFGFWRESVTWLSTQAKPVLKIVPYQRLYVRV